MIRTKAPKRKIFEDFWEEFEDQCAQSGLVSNVPNCMKKILTACGYNNAWAFKEITDVKIQELEVFVQSHHRKLAESFDEYKDISPFQFLPGHRTMIKGIQTEILSIEAAAKKTKVSNPKSNDMPNEEDLKMNLIDQISNYSSKISIDFDWSGSIRKFSIKNNDGGTLAECTISCPKCSAVRTVRYDKHWKASNLFKHIKTHVENQENLANKTTNSLQTESTNEDQQSVMPNANHCNSDCNSTFSEIQFEVHDSIESGYENDDWLDDTIEYIEECDVDFL